MKIFPLGVGGAFTKSNYHNNYIMQLNEKYLLIDAGTTLRNSLRDANFQYTDIDFVFISHLHFDHVGGLEELVMQRFWQFHNGQHTPLKTTIIVHEKLLHSLKALLKNGLENQGRTVDDFCDFICLSNQEVFDIEHYHITIFDTSDYHVQDLLSFGFKISWDAKNIVFSGDIKKLAQAMLLEQVDSNTIAIFQDVSFTENGVHATFEEVLQYYPNRLHEKIYAMHYNDEIARYLNDIEQANIKLVKKHENLIF